MSNCVQCISLLPSHSLHNNPSATLALEWIPFRRSFHLCTYEDDEFERTIHSVISFGINWNKNRKKYWNFDVLDSMKNLDWDPKSHLHFRNAFTPKSFAFSKLRCLSFLAIDALKYTQWNHADLIYPSFQILWWMISIIWLIYPAYVSVSIWLPQLLWSYKPCSIWECVYAFSYYSMT